ncbi:MAG: PTS sugar transporter subunit IIA [FCB group bacterium]|nr:PTS sugar transporter subunit IIA [FCB group bacterium]
MDLHLDQLLNQDHILLDLDVKDKDEAIDRLTEVLQDAPEVINITLLREDIRKRESEIPTGLENGAAMPHARSKAVNNLILAFARLKNGVDFGAQDGIPASLIFEFGIPPDQISQYLKIIAKLSRFLKKRGVREKLLEASSPEEILETFAEREN